MISKEKFVKLIEAYQKYSEWDTALYKLGIDLINSDILQGIIINYIDMLNIVMEQEEHEPIGMTDLEYFIYDVECGKRCDDYYIEDNGEIVKWHNAEEFYDYVAKEKELNESTKSNV